MNGGGEKEEKVCQWLIREKGLAGCGARSVLGVSLGEVLLVSEECGLGLLAELLRVDLQGRRGASQGTDDGADVDVDVDRLDLAPDQEVLSVGGQLVAGAVQVDDGALVLGDAEQGVALGRALCVPGSLEALRGSLGLVEREVVGRQHHHPQPDRLLGRHARQIEGVGHLVDRALHACGAGVHHEPVNRVPAQLGETRVGQACCAAPVGEDDARLLREG